MGTGHELACTASPARASSWCMWVEESGQRTAVSSSLTRACTASITDVHLAPGIGLPLINISPPAAVAVCRMLCAKFPGERHTETTDWPFDSCVGVSPTVLPLPGGTNVWRVSLHVLLHRAAPRHATCHTALHLCSVCNRRRRGTTCARS